MHSLHQTLRCQDTGTCSLPQQPTTITDELGIALSNLADTATGVLTPTLRLGVTGLSRAGKTIFITALVHNLLTQGRLPGFAPLADGRFIGARLANIPTPPFPALPMSSIWPRSRPIPRSGPRAHAAFPSFVWC